MKKTASCAVFTVFILTSGIATGKNQHFLSQQSQHCCDKKKSNTKRWKKRKNRVWTRTAARAIGGVLQDAVRINLGLFSYSTLKVAVATTPFYLFARMHDEKIQSNFYDPATHTNVCQLPQACHKIAKYSVGVPMILLSTLAFWGPTEDLRTTGRIFGIGVPFVHFGKDIIKSIDLDCCLRPWHEAFDNKKRASGGFPSGHMANITYTTALFGMRYGPLWAVPLGSLATFVFVDFLNCNRHYISQLVAGVGLGLMFAFAANNVINQKLAEGVRVTPCFNFQERTAGLNLAYRW